jgi:phosphotransferase system  glucose/maltose/N-acetylglucosamine-specific IIC component
MVVGLPRSFWSVVWGDLDRCSVGKVNMILNQSYVLLAVAIVVALINFFGAYFAVRKARAERSNPEGNKPQAGLIRSLRSSQ